MNKIVAYICNVRNAQLLWLILTLHIGHSFSAFVLFSHSTCFLYHLRLNLHLLHAVHLVYIQNHLSVHI